MAADKKRKNCFFHAITDIALIALVVLMYSVMSKPDTINVFGRDIIYRTSKKDTISLECVVAWDSSNIPDILKILQSSSTHITFVVSGNWAKQNAILLKQMVAANHSIATCGMNYSDTQILSYPALTESIKQSAQIINESCGFGVKYYYCPVANTKTARRAASAANLLCIRSTTDLLSARGSEADILNRATQSAKAGNIIMFTPTTGIKNALPQILETYKAEGLCISPVT